MIFMEQDKRVALLIETYIKNRDKKFGERNLLLQSIIRQLIEINWYYVPRDIFHDIFFSRAEQIRQGYRPPLFREDTFWRNTTGSELIIFCEDDRRTYDAKSVANAWNTRNVQKHFQKKSATPEGNRLISDEEPIYLRKLFREDRRGNSDQYHARLWTYIEPRITLDDQIHLCIEAKYKEMIYPKQSEVSAANKLLALAENCYLAQSLYVGHDCLSVMESDIDFFRFLLSEISVGLEIDSLIETIGDWR